MITLEETRDKIIAWAEEKKAEGIVSLDISGKTSYTDLLIICHGTNELHVKAIAENITENAKKEKIQYLAVEGLENSTWVLIDFIDIIVHIFNEKTRNYYKLEDLWKINAKNKSEMSKNDKE
ncbi:MAG: hypothetical protein APR54_07295 [Candidatus Cloacimonas sp. SDB]|nr:MAG: hypothetical protein APR54_07295 [Candidatus Cloacimonas sp. SDB]